ncbi:MAG: tetratricopeptide repeat protein [Phycisphaerales bacterium]|nr:tetratricopeptide repeat protein [Phycisphaerales bacterium]MCB9836316.1 tetratricopeptide repeat protein [Phycisphaera sp.]
MLDRSILCALGYDEHGEKITASFGVLVDKQTALVALAPLLGCNEIRVHNFNDDAKVADGFVGLDVSSGLALLRVPEFGAKPYSGPIEALPPELPETLVGVLVADQVAVGAPGIGFEAFTTKGLIECYDYNPLILLHKRPQTIFAGSVILGSPNSIIGIVTTPINPYTVGISAIADYKSMVRWDKPVQGDRLQEYAEGNIAKAMLLTYQAQNLSHNDQPKAQELIERAAELDPANPMIWYLQGEYLSSQEKYQAAILAYLKAVELGANWGNLWYALGYSQFKQGDIQAATASLEFAIEHDIYHPAALGLLAMLRYSDSRFNAGFDLALRASAIENDNLTHILTLRKCNERIERWGEMMPYWYRYMRSTNSRDVDLWRDYISGFMGAFEYRVMTREAERGLELIGEQDFLLAAIAWRRLLDQQFDDAIDLATRALEINPENRLADNVLNNARDPIILGEDGED